MKKTKNIIQDKIINFYNQNNKTTKINDTQWSLWCKWEKSDQEKEEIIIESILTQQTNWNNVEKAFNNLKKAKKNSLDIINNTSKKELKKLIKPAGFYQRKVQYLKNIAKLFINNGIINSQKISTNILRQNLLNIKGVGKETADSILLYAFNRPIFVIDNYTKKWLKDFKIPVKNPDYDYLQKFFSQQLPKKARFYQQFHAFIVLYYKNNKNNKK